MPRKFTVRKSFIINRYRPWLTIALLIIGLMWPLVDVAAQKANAKLPSAEKIVNQYLKAMGGRKRLVAIHDASYEWSIQFNDQQLGLAKTDFKTPSSMRLQMIFGNGEIVSAANGSSAWSKGLDGEVRTLTGAEAGALKLQALLTATHLVDFKKANVAARVVSLSEAPAPEYVVEFSQRSGAKLVYYFSRTSGLVTRIENHAGKNSTRFSDYRVEDGVQQPHRLDLNLSGPGELTLVLRRVSYNTGVPDSLFDPPAAAESLNVSALLRAVVQNQDELEKRATEYSFLQKETDRELNNKGELKKETVKVYEIFPVAHREPIQKLISENGVPLSAERQAREAKRVAEEFEKAERDRDKNEKKAEQRRVRRARKKANEEDDSDVEISQFLRVSEFISPRRERFRDREAVVFDFRPRAGFQPKNRQETLISKLVGVVWIDPADKQIMRLEARLAEGFKMAGGLLLSLRPGAALVMEQTRMLEGIWLPRLAQINLSVKVLLFGGGDINKTIEWSEYKHFSGDVGDYKLDAPKTEDPDKKP